LGEGKIGWAILVDVGWVEGTKPNPINACWVTLTLYPTYKFKLGELGERVFSNN